MSDDDWLFTARLRTALDTFTALSAQRRVRALTISKLITHQRTLAVLRELTGETDPDLACQHARRLLGRPGLDRIAPPRSAVPPAAPQPSPSPAPSRPARQRAPKPAPKPSAAMTGKAPRRAKPTAASVAWGSQRAGTPSTVACRVCGLPLAARLAALRVTVHPSCQPVPCQSCFRPFSRTVLVNRLCPACSRKPTPQHRKGAGTTAGRVRKRTPMEQANWARQAAQRSEAKRLAALRRRDGCPECGNHGDHQCGKVWRLADGKIGKRRRGKGKGSVWTVRGGLPSLGKRSH